MEFHDKLRSARTDAGLTQQQVADKMGITKSTYCGYETGKREPDVRKIKELAQILNVTGSYLIGKRAEKPPRCIPARRCRWRGTMMLWIIGARRRSGS